ncbi:MAG TPA: OmpA family protein [Gammaproteobacteria bacterium]|nr:OmpA family protein [Gammaproteobacteria bacterium]
MMIEHLRRRRSLCILLLSAAFACGAAAAQDQRAALFADANQSLAAAKKADAELLAPQAYERGMRAYTDANSDLERGRSTERIRTALADAVTAFKHAAQTAESAKVTLAALIKTRTDAANAHADKFAAEQWTSAEEGFGAAARRLESGDLRGSRNRAEEAEKQYRDAELSAIKAQYLSQTQALLAEADQARVPRYAPKTFAHAQALLGQAEQALNQNRYDTDLPRSLARQANQEARHAIYLAKEIREMRANNLDTEDIILEYEAPLLEIAAAADKSPQLDQGVDAIAKDLAAYIEDLREQAQQSQNDLEESRTRVAELEDEVRDLDKRLGGVSQERVALVQKLEAEQHVRDQFDTIEKLFARDEARVSREGNTLVLRMVGLTFPSGQTEIGSADSALLEKVRQAVNIFPNAQVVIEGHTDSYGSDAANLELSRKRAEAVKAYLTTQLGVPGFRISAMGYGETRPIASNDTQEGRERNRRIDIRILPQVE